MPRLEAVEEDAPTRSHRTSAERIPRSDPAWRGSCHQPLPTVPVCEQAWIDGELDIVLSTHATLVVHARLEPGPVGMNPCGEAAAAQQASGIDLGLVIARAHCRGDRPQLAALLEAARVAVHRTRVGARHGLQEGWQLVTRVAGRPCRLMLGDDADRDALAQRPAAA